MEDNVYKLNAINSNVLSEELLNYLLEQFPLGNSSIHGEDHWMRVLYNGRLLAKETGANLNVVELFAVLHDCKRDNDDYDLEHGRRAAEYIEEIRSKWLKIDETLEEIKKLQSKGILSIKTPCQIVSLDNEKELRSINIKFDDGKTEKIQTDVILGFFGLIMKLGPIAEWGLNMDKKTIEVNPENFETNKKGIFAAGDICSYPGKLKLILSGFHEVALASVECFKRARPNEKYRFEFTTSSKTIQDRLGKK